MTRFNVFLQVCLLALGLALSVAAQEPAPTSEATVTVPQGPVPRLVRFTGVLQSIQEESRAGIVGVTFALYKEQEGGAPLWVETQNVELDADGRYTVLLGATKTEGLPEELFLSSEARWLGIQMKGEKEQRVLLVAVPYAFKAADAETLGGKPVSAFLLAPEDKPAQTPAPQPANALGGLAPFYTATSATGPSFISLATTGTPITVASTELVTNLNADLLDGLHAGDLSASTHTHALPGTGNTGVGASALSVNAGSNNTAMGSSALAANTTANKNTAVGATALNANTTGNSNTAMGANALLSNTTGLQNTAVGRDALLLNNGSNNTAVGTSALDANTSGSENIALGVGALGSNTTAFFNTAVGSHALMLNSTGAGNTAVGANALQNNTTAFNNAAVGFHALLLNTTGTNNTAVGSEALGSNTTANNNTAVGRFALAANTTGFENTAVGASALLSSTGNTNTALGAFALDANTSGSSNTAVGRNALGANLTASDNTAIGTDSLLVSSAAGNTGVGAYVLIANTSGASNTAVGIGALFNNTTGSNNIALGANAGANTTTGSNNTYIGNVGVAGEANTIRIGTGLETRAFISGVRAATTGVNDAIPVLIDSAGQLGTVSSTRRAKEDIRDMGGASAGLFRLRPVLFRYRQPMADGSKPLQYGLIAEEVAGVMPELVVYGPDGLPQTVQYHVLPALLLNELQRQQKHLDQQTAELAELRARLEKQDAELAELKTALRTTLAQR